MKQEYAIYGVEQLESPLASADSGSPSGHVFLVLARPDPTEQEPPFIEKELHFVNKDGFIRTKIGIAPHREYLFPWLETYEVARGDIETIRPIWEKVCDDARQLSELGIDFSRGNWSSPYAHNCCAATRAVSAASGLSTHWLTAVRPDGEQRRGAAADLVSFFPKKVWSEVIQFDFTGGVLRLGF